MIWLPPEESPLGDHDVEQLADYLQGKSIALCVTGSVAAMKTPLLARALRRYGAKVTVFIDKSGLRFVTADALRWATNQEIITELSYRSEHLNGGHPFDAYLIAPATYNTINKIACGIADSLITTTMSSAMGMMGRKKTKVLIAPAMHGSMHNDILTESLAKLAGLGVTLIKPRQQYGKNNLPPQDVLVMEVCRAVNQRTDGQAVLVTGGAVGVKIDAIRRLTNKFSGKLGITVATELYLRGHHPLLLQSVSGIRPPSWLPYKLYEEFDEYLRLCKDNAGSHRFGIYSAAVADYRPASVAEGKLPSGNENLSIPLVPTSKVIDEVHNLWPQHQIISFKYEHDASIEDLVTIAKQRLANHVGVVANSGSIKGPSGEQAAFLFSNGCSAQYKPKVPLYGTSKAKIIGKKQIAKILVDEIEKSCGAFTGCCANA